MLQKLQVMELRLSHMLMIPHPQTTKDRHICIPDNKFTFPAPILQMWTPPQWIPSSKDNGFWLAQHVICYQRGYFPSEIYDQYMRMASMCFKKPEQCERDCMDQLAYDFLIAIVTYDNKVTAGCVVEFRPSKSLVDDPYLYVSTLCTHPQFSSKGLAHQLVHAVYTLGTIMIEQNDKAPGIWHHAIPNKHLYIGLTVAKTPGSNMSDRLLHLYSQCGLSTHKDKHIEYDSFTPYSVYEWQLEKETTKIAMWKSIALDVLYEDEQVCILSPTSIHSDCSFMYHTFPIESVELVSARGIVHQKHRFLHANDVYSPSEIQFTKTDQVKTDTGSFCIQVKPNLDTFTLRISVPVWFAVTIHGSDTSLNI